MMYVTGEFHKLWLFLLVDQSVFAQIRTAVSSQQSHTLATSLQILFEVRWVAVDGTLMSAGGSKLVQAQERN